MNARNLILLALVAGLVTAAFADAQLSKVDGGKDQKKQQNEAGQNINRGGGGNSGPDSWQFWGPNRQLLADTKPEAGQKTNFGPDGYQAWTKRNEAGQKATGDSGPDSWQFWGPNRQLLTQGKDTKPEAGQKTNYGPDGYQAWTKKNEAGQKVHGSSSGPDSWQFWGPNRQLLADAKPEAGQKATAGPDSWQFWNKQNEAGQNVNGGTSGPNSWQFWGPNRQLLSTGTQKGPEPKKVVNEAGQSINRGGGGNSGPDSWQFWGPNRQLLADAKPEAGQKATAGPDSWQFWNKQNEAGQNVNGGTSGPNSWQFWGPNRQLLADTKPEAGQKTNFGPDGYQAWTKKNEAGQVNKPVVNPKPAATTPTKQAEAAPKPATAKPQQQAPVKQAEAAPKPAAGAPTKQAESAPKAAATKPQQQAPAKQPEAAPKQQAPQKKQDERGARYWGSPMNVDFAGMPGGGNSYSLQNNRNIYTAAGWGGAPTTCAQGERAHACSTRKLLRKFLFRL